LPGLAFRCPGIATSLAAALLKRRLGPHRTCSHDQVWSGKISDIWHQEKWGLNGIINGWLVVSNIFYFPEYMGQSSQLTFIFFRGVETTNQMEQHVKMMF